MANAGGSSCRLRYHCAEILVRPSCVVWRRRRKTALRPVGFWRSPQFMTARRAPRRHPPRPTPHGGTFLCAHRLHVVPPCAGLFSSFGLLYADVEYHYARTFRRVLRGADLSEVDAAWNALSDQIG